MQRAENIEDLLIKHEFIQIAPKGYSMYPVIVPGRDMVIMKRADYRLLKRGDVALFRRSDNTLVLHRIWKVKKDGMYFVGDNQSIVEGPVTEKMVIGVVTDIIRKGKRISADNVIYRLITHVWLFLRPVRDYIKTAAAGLKRIVKGK